MEQTVQGLTCSIMDKPHTGLHDCSEYATLVLKREKMSGASASLGAVMNDYGTATFKKEPVYFHISFTFENGCQPGRSRIKILA